MRSSRLQTVVAVVLGVVLLAAVGVVLTVHFGRKRPATDADVPPALLSEFNRAVAILEQYRYGEARQAFERILEKEPDFAAAKLNLAIALLNQKGQEKKPGEQRAEDTGEAEGLLRDVLEREPGNLRAKFVLAFLLNFHQRYKEAVPLLEDVLEADPEDPFVLYLLGDCYEKSDPSGSKKSLLAEKARGLFVKATEVEPAFLSAQNRLLAFYRALRDKDALDAGVKLVKALSDHHFKMFHGLAYSESGRYGFAERLEGPEKQVPAGPEPKVAFASRASLPGEERPALALADLDNDGGIEILTCALAEGDRRRDRVIRLAGSPPAFETAPAPTGDVPSAAACFGDFDNDGDADLYAAGTGPGRLFRNDGGGKFVEITAESGIGSGVDPKTSGRAAMMLDADHDEDLDILVVETREGKDILRLLNNNRDGRFTDVAPTAGFAEPEFRVSFVLFSDLDGNDLQDLALFDEATGAMVIFDNQLLWNFRRVEVDMGTVGIPPRKVFSAVTGDYDKDGDEDLLLFRGDDLVLLVNEGRFSFRRDGRFSALEGLGGTTGRFADLENDGDLDIVVADAGAGLARHPSILLNDGMGSFSDRTGGSGLEGIEVRDPAMSVVDLDRDGRLDLVVMSRTGSIHWIRNETETQNHWLSIDLVGGEADGPKMGTMGGEGTKWSNRPGIGAKVEVKAGGLWQKLEVTGNDGLRARGLYRVHFGLGKHPKVDFLRIIWPDRILQAEIEVAGDRIIPVAQEQRKPSSCPIFYAWDGERFRFVADFLGVGGLGFFSEPGGHVPPDPDEYVVIPHLRPKDGAYEIRVVEPMEEVCYVDLLRLVAVDHPEELTVYPEEYFVAKGPRPRFRLLSYADPILPVRATDDRGNDVTERILAVDRRYPDVPVDHRFTGYAKDHFIELDFGDRLGRLAPGTPVVLYLYGWVEYGYSRTNWAAYQAGVRGRAPTVSVFEDGRWRVVADEVGYPAGLPRMMTLDLAGKIGPRTERIRIGTNLEIYWDRIFLAEDRGTGGLRVTDIGAERARLGFLGYPQEHSPDGRKPNLYDYQNVLRFAPWRVAAGAYTRFGDVTPLLADPDDLFVILGPGEEIALSFAESDLPPLPAGYRRTFILRAEGYSKALDLYTAHPDTVEPLPFRGMSNYPYGRDEHYPDTGAHKEYRKTYNTRRVSG